MSDGSCNDVCTDPSCVVGLDLASPAGPSQIAWGAPHPPMQMTGGQAAFPLQAAFEQRASIQHAQRQQQHAAAAQQAQTAQVKSLLTGAGFETSSRPRGCPIPECVERFEREYDVFRHMVSTHPDMMMLMMRNGERVFAGGDRDNVPENEQRGLADVRGDGAAMLGGESTPRFSPPDLMLPSSLHHAPKP
jgi:hypothetical protein